MITVLKLPISSDGFKTGHYNKNLKFKFSNNWVVFMYMNKYKNPAVGVK